MKAAAHYKPCFTDLANAFHVGILQRRNSLHKPRRHAVGRPAVQPVDADAPARRLGAAVLFSSKVKAALDTAADSQFGAGRPAIPRVLHIDADCVSATVLASLLEPEARVLHVKTLAEARQLLLREIFSLVVLDPSLPDGDGGALLPALERTPLLVYSARHPEWRKPVGAFLPKPWTSPRQLWSTISGLLGIAPNMSAGD